MSPFASGLRQHAINRIDQLDEIATTLRLRGCGNVHGEVGVDVRRVAAEHDDAIGEDDGFFDVVRDDENRARRNFVAEPELEQFAAQRFGGEHVERGERLVHEEHFGLNDECAGDADALFHAAREFFRIGALESVEADGVDDAQRALVALDRRHAARFERRFDIFENGEPRKQREALKNDARRWAIRRAPAGRARKRRRRKTARVR